MDKHQQAAVGNIFEMFEARHREALEEVEKHMPELSLAKHRLEVSSLKPGKLVFPARLERVLGTDIRLFNMEVIYCTGEHWGMTVGD